MNKLRHTIYRQLAPIAMAAAILALPVAGSAENHNGGEVTTILKSVPQPKFWDLVFESMYIYERPISGEPLWKYHYSGTAYITAYIELGSSIDINCKYRIEADVSLAEADLPQWNRPNVQFLTEIKLYKRGGNSTAGLVRQALRKNTLPQLGEWADNSFENDRFSHRQTAQLGPRAAKQVGTYYARCETDGYNDIVESNEGNNGGSSTASTIRFVVHDNSFPADAFKAEITKPKTGYVQEDGYMMDFGVDALNYDYRPDDVNLWVERYDQSANNWAHVWSHQMTEPPASYTVDFSPLGDGFYRIQVHARSTAIRPLVGFPTCALPCASGMSDATG